MATTENLEIFIEVESQIRCSGALSAFVESNLALSLGRAEARYGLIAQRAD